MVGDQADAEAVIAELDRQWGEALSPGGFEESVEDLEKHHEIARSLVGIFLEAVPDLVPDDVETRMVVDLVDPRTLTALPVPLLGYADAIVGSTVVELKTAARKASPWKWRMQLAAYSLAYQQLRGSRPRMRVIQLIKTKTPTVIVDEVETTERDELWFSEIAAEVLDAVRARAFVANPGWMCRGCEYRERCGAA
jgi:CRISPR/Cas system-associated exonuclease Cas4 (RecB family)